MTGAILGGAQLGCTVLGSVNQPFVSPFQPAWAIQANIVIQVRRIES
jgi:hypothetical protein